MVRDNLIESGYQIKEKIYYFLFLLRDVELPNINFMKEKLIIDCLLKLLKKYNINGKFEEPNDISVDDSKILGILIETKLNYRQLIRLYYYWNRYKY